MSYTLLDEVYHIEPREIYDQALIGYDELTHCAVYSRELILKVIIDTVYAEIEERNAEIEDDEDKLELDREDAQEQAIEYYVESMLGVDMGEGTPIFVSTQLLRDD